MRRISRLSLNLFESATQELNAKIDDLDTINLLYVRGRMLIWRSPGEDTERKSIVHAMVLSIAHKLGRWVSEFAAHQASTDAALA